MRTIILAYNPNYVDINTIEETLPRIEARLQCHIYMVAHHKTDEKPIYLVYNNLGVEHVKEKQEGKVGVVLQVPVLRGRKSGKKLARR